MRERLQKILAAAGLASRRASEALIREGRVSVNGAVVREVGTKANPERDEVRVDGERIRPARTSWSILHKPPGTVTTLDDPEGRPTIRDCLPPGLDRVFPVGRLDYHSTGLVLLTNDGELAAKLLHPSAEIPRTYRAKVLGHPTPEAIRQLRTGVVLEDGRTGPAEVRIDSKLPGKTWLELTLREGRYREVRRMCEAVGHPVDRLVRVRFGPIELGRLRIGEWRSLDAREVEALRDVVAKKKKASAAIAPGARSLRVRKMLPGGAQDARTKLDTKRRGR